MRTILLDIDGTLVEEGLWSCLIEQLLEDGLGNAGILRNVLEDLNTPGRSGMKAIRNGIPAALCELSMDSYLDAADQAWERVRPMPFMRELAAALRRCWVDVVLISGAPQVLAVKIGELFAASEVIACTITPGTGFRRIVDSSGAKSLFTRQVLRARGDDPKQTIAIGNGRNDIGMLEQVRFPVAFEPSEQLRRRAEEADWPITDRNGLLVHLDEAMGLK
jgi:phosphoserine phosphatase